MRYVLECAGLYIKDGGFTTSLSEAKKYRTKSEAAKDCVYPWIIKPYHGDKKDVK